MSDQTPGFQWRYLSLADLRLVLRDVVRSGPNVEDREFIQALANEIAQREKAAKPWIVAYDATSQHTHPPYTLECRRCLGTYSPSLPVSIALYAALARAFEKQHAKCAKETET